MPLPNTASKLLSLIALIIFPINNDAQSPSAADLTIHAPLLINTPEIDGYIDEWKDVSFSDGIWDIQRLSHTPWFDQRINRLTDHGSETHPNHDLQARYYIAWDEQYLYLAAEGWDNINDVEDPEPGKNRWWFMDAVAWYMEAPRDEAPESFNQGDNAFCFVIDPRKPDYGAWWMHGTTDNPKIHEPLPKKAVDYEVRLNPWGGSNADFVLEARVDMEATFGVRDPNWKAPEIGDLYSLEIVHTDPDGGKYGGHFVLYGNGDDDSTWAKLVLVGPSETIKRLKE